MLFRSIQAGSLALLIASTAAAQSTSVPFPLEYAGFDGVIKLGGVWSLTPGTSWYGYSQQMRRAQQMAIDFINLERGGITVDGKKYGVHAFWVDDQSSKQLVTNATAHAGRGWGADFMLGGYSSGVTTYTTKQSYADGYILVAPGAASTSVFP